MLFLLADIALAALIASAIFIRGRWPLEPAAGVLTQLALLASGFAIASILVREPLGAAIAAGGAGLAFWRTHEVLGKPSRKVADPAFKVVWANLFKRRRSFEAVQRLALGERADLLALGEFPEGAKLLPEFAAAFPHQFPNNPTPTRDVVIFSRHPFETSAEALSGWRRPRLTVSVRSAGDSLTISAVHAPVPWTPKRLALQRRYIAEAFSAAQPRASTIIVGDFNAAVWNEVLDNTAEFERLRLGQTPTWLSHFPLLGIAIDHAFVSRGLEGSIARGPFNGSDHFPIIVSVKAKARGY